jgi:hypothetical protein
MARLKTGLGVFGLALVAVVAWLTFNMAVTATTGPFARVSDQIATFTTIFLGIFIEAAPFLLLGALASGLVEVFVNQDHLARYIPHDPVRGALVGAALGFLFPVCECGVVPLTRRLFKKGLPLSVGITFLLAAPVFNPIAIASTIAAFGVGKVLWLRLGLTFLIAVATGLIFAAQPRPERLWRAPALAPISGGRGDVAPTPVVDWRGGLKRVAAITVDEFFEMGRYLIVGALLAALMQAVVPQAFLLGLSAGPVISVITLIALAIVLSICSTVDAFIALALAGTFTTGSITAFLVFGPMVDIKSTLMFLGVFKRRTVAYLILLPLLMTMLAGVFINLDTRW